MSDQRERLAALSHEQWSGWVKYMFEKGTTNPAGTWTMPQWAVERWTRQMNTAYTDLSEIEKHSDRAEADRVLALLIPPPPPSLEALARETAGRLPVMPLSRLDGGLEWLDETTGIILSALNSVSLRDYAEYDGTDGAHPAWWRGHDRACAQTQEVAQRRTERIDGLLREVAEKDADMAALKVLVASQELLIDALKCERSEKDAKIAKVKKDAEVNDTEWRHLWAMGYKSIDTLQAAGMGAPGKGSCLIDMVEEACAEIARLTAELQTARAFADENRETINAQFAENIRLITENDKMREAITGVLPLLELIGGAPCQCDFDTGMYPCESCCANETVKKFNAALAPHEKGAD